MSLEQCSAAWRFHVIDLHMRAPAVASTPSRTCLRSPLPLSPLHASSVRRRRCVATSRTRTAGGVTCSSTRGSTAAALWGEGEGEARRGKPWQRCTMATLAGGRLHVERHADCKGGVRQGHVTKHGYGASCACSAACRLGTQPHPCTSPGSPSHSPGMSSMLLRVGWAAAASVAAYTSSGGGAPGPRCRPTSSCTQGWGWGSTKEWVVTGNVG